MKKKNKKANNDSQWFKITMLLLIILFALFCIIIISSPKEDLQKRGFIPCTETMADEIMVCQNKVLCVMRSILKNTYCDSKVIGAGFSNWIKGKQKNPWSNYLFEPEVEEDYTDEDLTEFYEENPNIVEEMQRLKKLHEDLENGKTTKS